MKAPSRLYRSRASLPLGRDFYEGRFARDRRIPFDREPISGVSDDRRSSNAVDLDKKHTGLLFSSRNSSSKAALFDRRTTAAVNVEKHRVRDQTVRGMLIMDPNQVALEEDLERDSNNMGSPSV